MFWIIMAIALTFYFGPIGLMAVTVAIILAGE